MFLYDTLCSFLNAIVGIGENVLLGTLAAGPLPKHVAFIIDGNRRYARARNMETFSGHVEGMKKIKKALEICLHLNINCVSIYAFSKENFQRSEEEVEAMMNLLERTILKLFVDGNFGTTYGLRFNLIGRRELLPARVQLAAKKAENHTAHHERAMCNVFIAYTSRDEITTAVQSSVKNSLAEDPRREIISEQNINEQLMTTLVGSPPLDILIRTGGAHRLSDFLLWQCCENTQIQFLKKYWPEFGLLDLVRIILDYQRKAWGKEAGGGRDSHLIDRK